MQVSSKQFIECPIEGSSRTFQSLRGVICQLDLGRILCWQLSVSGKRVRRQWAGSAVQASGCSPQVFTSSLTFPTISSSFSCRTHPASFVTHPDCSHCLLWSFWIFLSPSPSLLMENWDRVYLTWKPKERDMKYPGEWGNCKLSSAAHLLSAHW